MKLRWVCEPSDASIAIDGIVPAINHAVEHARVALIRDAHAIGLITKEVMIKELYCEDSSDRSVL